MTTSIKAKKILLCNLQEQIKDQKTILLHSQLAHDKVKMKYDKLVLKFRALDYEIALQEKQIIKAKREHEVRNRTKKSKCPKSLIKLISSLPEEKRKAVIAAYENML